MIKKVAIVLGILILLFLAGGAWWMFKQQEEKTPVGEPKTVLVPTTVPTVENLVWNDPAGFIFNYDFSLKIDNHPEDKVNYANLTITKTGEEGKIQVFAKDSKYKDVNDWVKKDTSLTGGEIEEATLGGKLAKKITFENSSKIIVGTIDSVILFTLEFDPSLTSGATPARDYLNQWQERFSQITSTFEFWYPTPAAGQSSGGQSSGDIIEEEEIIQ